MFLYLPGLTELLTVYFSYQFSARGSERVRPRQPCYFSFRYAAALAKPFSDYQKAFKPLSFCVTLIPPRRNFLFRHSRIKERLAVPRKSFLALFGSIRFGTPDLLILLLYNVLQLASTTQVKMTTASPRGILRNFPDKM